jgi:hypothetical protein
LKQGNRRQHDVVLMGDLKETTWRFDSAPSFAQGGKWPGWAKVGQRAMGLKADRASFSAKQRRMVAGHTGSGLKSKNKENGFYKCFLNLFQRFLFQIKGFKYFQTKFELRSNWDKLK